MKKQDELYTVAEAAKVINVCVETIRRYIASGKLPALKLPGGNYRIKQADLKLVVRK